MNRLQFAIACALGATFVATPVIAQETEDENRIGIAAPTLAPPESTIEEVVVMGRLIDSSQSLALERMDDAAVTDLLGAETISRLGDSTVAVALKRIPGLSVVGNKFVYIRGLGERYSQSTLNGAFIPSPDLTRNVIPLDIFPTAIVESLRVQKAYTADMRANFAGGSVDIRTKGIPDDFTVMFEIGSGFNTAVDGSVFTYAGGSRDALGYDNGERSISPELLNQVENFQGQVGTQEILSFLRRQDPFTPLADAQQINRQLGLALNRDFSVEETDPIPDIDVRGSIGDSFILNEDWEIGYFAGASYEHQWREEETFQTNFNFPEEQTRNQIESTRTVAINAIGNLGINYTDEHSISTMTLFLRNTDDETEIDDFFDDNRQRSDGLGSRNYRFQFEERNMVVNQIRGEHRLGERTREVLGPLAGLISWLPADTEIEWFVSQADARTDIPNQVNVTAQTITDTETGAVQQSFVTQDATTALFRFTDLDDDVDSSGIKFKVPFSRDRSYGNIQFGFDTDSKARTYRQDEFSIGVLNADDPSILAQPLGEVFSDENILNPANNYLFDRRGTQNQSYLAATITDGAFGQVDWTFNDTWRVAAGLRWEDYRQAALDWNPFGFTEASPQVTTDPAALENAVFQQDDLYPSLAVTYMSDWLAETFQLRFGYSETAIRPDLREITDASYIDPITDDLVDGNPGVIPSTITSYDIRGEWFFNNGDNFTVTAFLKEIDDPIEFFESAASDLTVAREIINAESAEVYGLEIEGLKNLAFLGDPFAGFFLQGNVTLQDSELVAGEQADAPTNPVRKLTAASDYVANVTLGYDSDDGKHAATLVYNVFGERLYVAGRNGAPDGFEQPFHGLDATYSWFPTDRIVLKFKARNLLGEEVTIEREGIETFREDPGSTFSFAFQWSY
ncbi:MAG: TonB-dependent receptor [Pseudomonadota bacterium]